MSSMKAIVAVFPYLITATCAASWFTRITWDLIISTMNLKEVETLRNRADFDDKGVGLPERFDGIPLGAVAASVTVDVVFLNVLVTNTSRIIHNKHNVNCIFTLRVWKDRRQLAFNHNYSTYNIL